MTPLLANPRVAQMKTHKERKIKKSKAKLSQPICCCFKHHIHKTEEFVAGEGYLGLPQKGVPMQ